MRADARDNRARIMAAADEVFGRAPGASTDDVAKLAGVGIATVFRHFPTKTDLFEAVLTRRLDRLRQRAVELAATNEPGAAFFEFFGQVVAEAATKVAVAEALTATGPGVGDGTRMAGSGLRQAIGALLARAQHSGAVRPDTTLPEVYALLTGASRGAIGLDPVVRRRMLNLIYDGLRSR